MLSPNQLLDHHFPHESCLFTWVRHFQTNPYHLRWDITSIITATGQLFKVELHGNKTWGTDPKQGMGCYFSSIMGKRCFLPTSCGIWNMINNQGMICSPVLRKTVLFPSFFSGEESHLGNHQSLCIKLHVPLVTIWISESLYIYICIYTCIYIYIHMYNNMY